MYARRVQYDGGGPLNSRRYVEIGDEWLSLMSMGRTGQSLFGSIK